MILKIKKYFNIFRKNILKISYRQYGDRLLVNLWMFFVALAANFGGQGVAIGLDKIFATSWFIGVPCSVAFYCATFSIISNSMGSNFSFIYEKNK